MSKIIYSYTTETYRQFRGWRKVGETTQESARIRVEQQDGTSNPERLEVEKTWDVPDHISDHDIHDELIRMGKKEVRLDKSREWFECSIQDIDSAINSLVLGVSRPNSYAMRDEQKECHDKIVAHFKSGFSNKALMNAKMRFGKTFVSYQIMKSLSVKRVMIITYKPAIDASWREDLELHTDFVGWKFNSAKDFSSIDPIELDDTGIQVLFTSFQDFNDFNKAKWSIAKNYHYDMIVVDEMHYGTKTERAQESLRQLNYNRILYASGTPLKALMGGEFLDEEIYSWGYADEQNKRTIEKNSKWATEIYRWLPVMNFHTYEVSEEAKRIVSLYSADEGFTMTKMFGTVGAGHNLKFKDEGAVKLFIDQMFGRTVRSDKSPMKKYPVDHTLIMMPNSVDSVTAFSNLLTKVVGDSYKIINASGDNVTELSKVKQLIQHNSKTITVTCGRFNTGVTVPEWDMVVMLDDGRSPESYFQTVFRCQSPDKKRRKEVCYVVDYNPQRCLEMVYEFVDLTAKKNQSTQQALREFLEFASILDHSDNENVNVDVNRILNMMSETGGYAERFGSQIMLNWEILDSVKNKFYNIDAESSVKVKDQITDNGLTPGKNYESNNDPKKKEKDPKETELKELRQRVITMMRRLPTYLFVEDALIENCADIYKVNNQELFLDAVGITIKNFNELCDGFIKTDRLDRCIMAYNQIEAL
jgi:superfamily II DNA or RNA helicase